MIVRLISKSAILPMSTNGTTAAVSVVDWSVGFQEVAKLLPASEMRRKAAIPSARETERIRVKRRPIAGGRSMLTLWLIKRRAIVEARKGR